MKAILVVDMPKNCDKCPLINGIHCMVTREEIEDPWGEIERNCPLKPIPQRKLTDLEKTTDYSCGWEQGYNACINEILGEEK